MAVRNFYEEEQLAKEKESFDKLINDIKNLDSEYFYAYQHIMRMKNDKEAADKKLQEYYSFFNTLSHLIPKQSSIHDIIG